MNELEDEAFNELHKIWVDAQVKLNKLLEEREMKELTLYEICAEDHSLFANLESDGEITVEVWDEQHAVVYKEKSNQHAWDSLVCFARMIVAQDKKIQKEIESE